MTADYTDIPNWTDAKVKEEIEFLNKILLQLRIRLNLQSSDGLDFINAVPYETNITRDCCGDYVETRRYHC